MTLFGNANTCTLAYYMYWAFPFLSNGGSAAAAADLLPGRTLFVFFLGAIPICYLSRVEAVCSLACSSVARTKSHVLSKMTDLYIGR